jgi:D-beta-D-heptose 7-phosphate kinase/D-beta-D-heptose 1-phosphate adenosyltransferase
MIPETIFKRYEYIKKPWGYEQLIELNDKYAVKKLFISENNRISLQYHREKTETLFLLQGTVKVTLNGEESIHKMKYTKINVPPNTIHRFAATEGSDVLLVEVSTIELDDVVRVEDDYNRNDKVVVVSGGFDPIHSGHLRLFKEAKELGSKLVVVVNNDNWLNNKKGYVFMSECVRIEIIEALRYVDSVYLTKHVLNDSDMSISKALEDIKPNIFANGGDRKIDNIPEITVCNKLGIELVFNVGGDKIASSSELVSRCV